MSSIDQAAQTQLNNKKKTGKSLPELRDFAADSGLAKHGMRRDFFRNELG
jgi:hypothetical protein